MTRAATFRRAAAPFAAWLAIAGAAAAADVRALDGSGRALTVGNWTWSTYEGSRVKVPSSRALSWELREGSTVLLDGAVPGTQDALADTGAVLSRNPATGAILLAWSRESVTGLREIVAVPFVDNAWLADRFTIVASGETVHQVDPALAHDAAGNAWIGWRELDSQGRVLLQVRAADGTLALEQVLSAGLSYCNGPPALGLDSLGHPVVSFFGDELRTGQRRLHLLGFTELGTALIHVPNPVIELAVTATEPASASFEGVFAAGRHPSQLHVEVLGTRTAAWWVRQEAGGQWLLEHLAQDAHGTWDGSSIGAISISSGTGEPVSEALAMLRAHLRSPLNGGAVHNFAVPSSSRPDRTLRR